MTPEEAEILEAIIHEAYPHVKVEIKERGGNQRAIYLKGNQTYIWSREEWYEKFAPSEKVEAEA